MAELPLSHSIPPRPPFLRGNTVPLYVRTASSSSSSSSPISADPYSSQYDKSLTPHSAHPSRTSSFDARFSQSNVRTSYQQHSQAVIPGPSRPTHFHLDPLPPTPPLSASPGSADSYPDETYFPPVLGSSSSAPRYSRSNGLVLPHFSPNVSLPTVIEGQNMYKMLRNTRAQAPHQSAKMRVDSSSGEYVLSAVIGPGFDSNCITISARKGNILDIVADRWDSEKDASHHEWQVQFDRDADMTGIHAIYTDGVLSVTVKRINYTCPRPPQLRP